MIVNHLQPIGLFALAIYYFNGKLGEYLRVLLMVYLVLGLMYSISVYNKIDYTKINLNQEILVRVPLLAMNSK
jgi:hypothetical protein